MIDEKGSQRLLPGWFDPSLTKHCPPPTVARRDATLDEKVGGALRAAILAW